MPLPFVGVLLCFAFAFAFALLFFAALGASTSLFDLFSFDRITVVRRNPRLASFFSLSARYRTDSIEGIT